MKVPTQTSAPVRPAGWLREPRGARRAGVIGTILAHLFLGVLFWSLPDSVLEVDRVAFLPTDAERVFEIELAQDWVVPAPRAEPSEPPRFVEVNPSAPDNSPDNTPLFGAQNQQVAQPEPSPVDPNTHVPAVRGEESVENGVTALVSGTATEPERPSLADALERLFHTDRPKDRVAVEPEPLRAVNAPGGGENLLGRADDAPGSTVTTLPPVAGAETGAEPRPGAAGSRRGGGYFAGSQAIDRTRPMERPRLPAENLRARQSPVLNNPVGTANIGVLAYNARWSDYGEYLQRLVDAVQAQWERLILRSQFYPTSGTIVTVVFRLNDQGEVVEFVAVRGEGGELARRLCVSAIAERAPYGPWPEDMKAALGSEQELTFRFFYQ